MNDQGWVVWVGDGNSWKDGITREPWQTKLSSAQSPWNYPAVVRHADRHRPLQGQRVKAPATCRLGNVLPKFRATWNNTVTYKRLTAYALVDGTFGQHINNQGEGWGLLDPSSSLLRQGLRKSVETAKPIGYRALARRKARLGGFYDILGPNNNNVQDASYAKIRETSLTYRIGARPRVGGDWTLGVIGRNVYTFTKYPGLDPEVGGSTDATCITGSGIINGVDAFEFPTLRRFTVSLSTRF